MALILNLETATTNCSVCLASDGVLLALKEFNSAQYSHAEKLHVFIQDVVKEAGKSMDVLDAVAVSMGPGSYTGLRIGVSAAKGLCYSLEIPLISVSTLEILARQVSIDKGLVLPVLDARRDEVYVAVFDNDHKLARDPWAEVVTTDSFKEFAGKGPLHFPGSGALKCSQILTGTNHEYYPDRLPSAREMVPISFEKFKNKVLEDVAYFEPFYLKDFITTAKKKG